MHLSRVSFLLRLNEIFATSHRRSIRFDDKKHEHSCTSRVLIVFSRKPPDVMEYRRSERRIMSKTNEAKRNKRPSPFLASEKGSRRCCCPARKMEGEFSRARPLVKSSHPPLLPPFPRGCTCVRPSSSHVRQKGRERATKGGKVRRETTAGRYDDDETRWGLAAEWGRSRSILLHSNSLGFRAVVSWCSRTSRDRHS